MLHTDKRHEENPRDGLEVIGKDAWANFTGHLPCQLTDHLSVLRSFLRGAEGEGEGEGGQDPPNDPNSTQGAGGQEPPANDEGDGEGEGDNGDNNSDTFSREYVEKLRQENAKYRKEAKEYKSKATEYEKAQMSELERAKTEREEAASRAQQLESQLQQERVSNAVLAAAMSKDFHDPSDVVQLIDTSAVKVDDDGQPDKKSVAALVNALAKEKPHLLKTSTPGSGDGGAQGSGVTSNERVASIQKEFDQKGMVKAPA